MRESLGSIDPQGERDAHHAQKETLGEVREQIGEETYRRIINKLADGMKIEQLTDGERAIIENIKSIMH